MECSGIDAVSESGKLVLEMQACKLVPLAACELAAAAQRLRLLMLMAIAM
jgi:hypothetical protein